VKSGGFFFSAGATSGQPEGTNHDEVFGRGERADIALEGRSLRVNPSHTHPHRRVAAPRVSLLHGVA